MHRADIITTFTFWLSWNLGTSNSWNRQGLSRPVTGIALPFSLFLNLWYNSVCGGDNDDDDDYGFGTLQIKGSYLWMWIWLWYTFYYPIFGTVSHLLSHFRYNSNLLSHFGTIAHLLSHFRYITFSYPIFGTIYGYDTHFSIPFSVQYHIS